MKLPREIRKQFQRYGRKGGKTRARLLSPTSRQAIARRAALKRWIEARFGSPDFSVLGLPGGDIIDKGLDDLVAGQETIESLVVSLAAPRLRREGVPLPKVILQDAEMRLYRLIEKQSGYLAHTRYLAYLRQIASFADACSQFLTDAGRRAS